MAITILALIIGMIIGALIGTVLQRNKITQAVADSAMLKTQADNLQTRLNELQVQSDRQLAGQKENFEKLLTEQHTQSDRQLAEQKENAERQQAAQRAQYEDRLAELRAQADRQKEELLTRQETLLKDLQTRHDHEKADMQARYEKTLNDLKEQQHEQLEQQARLIKEQITTTTERILKERAAELNTTNKEQLSSILTPLHENLRQMKEAVEKSDREQTITMERLGQSIQENLKQAKEVGQQADRLANALTSENKTQGNFGELRLRQMLEDMGFEEGIQFEEQVIMKENGQPILSEDGRRMIPDVILHFPDQRDVIIDSKMSIKAYVDYCNAEDDTQRHEALTRHIQSVRSHVKELADKKYYEHAMEGHKKLDFVMMYIPNDGALQLALTNDIHLWKDAYQQHVIISDSRSLYMMLSILEMTWRQKRQADNQDLIMKTANEIIDRVQVFWERLKKVEDQFQKTSDAFKELSNSAAPNGMSITTSANKLLKYGGAENSKRKMRLPRPASEAIEESENA